MVEKDLKKAIYGDPLRMLDAQEKELIMCYRHHCAEIPEALPKYLQCVNWADLDEVAEAHLLLEKWVEPTKEVCTCMWYTYN